MNLSALATSYKFYNFISKKKKKEKKRKEIRASVPWRTVWVMSGVENVQDDPGVFYLHEI